jgi:hypothetical protein
MVHATDPQSGMTTFTLKPVQITTVIGIVQILAAVKSGFRAYVSLLFVVMIMIRSAVV